MVDKLQSWTTSAYSLPLCFVVVLVSGNLESDVFAQSGAVPQDASRKQYLLEGIAARSEVLKSASFSASGRIKRKFESRELVVPEGDIYLKGAFDNGRLRFDYGEPQYVMAPAEIARRLKQPDYGNEEAKQLLDQPLKLEPKEFALARVETYFISTPDKAAYWFNGNPAVFLIAPNEGPPSFVTRFDLKALGLYGWLEFKKPMNIEQLLDVCRKKESFEVENLEGELWRLSFLFESKNTSYRWEIDINAGEGFTPVKSRNREIPKASGGAERIAQSSSVAWEKKHDAWVPVKYQIQTGSEEETNYQSLELAFTYDSVNESIDDSVFSYESFPTPKSARVIDASGAKPVVVGGPFDGDNSANVAPGERGVSGIRKWLVLINLAVLTVILALCGLWWTRKKRSVD